MTSILHDNTDEDPKPALHRDRISEGKKKNNTEKEKAALCDQTVPEHVIVQIATENSGAAEPGGIPFETCRLT